MDRIYPSQPTEALRPSVILSVLFHALLGVAWFYIAQSHTGKNAKELVQVEWIDAKPKTKTTPSITQDKSVVKTEAGTDEKPMAKETYLSDRDRRVDRETVARHTDMKETLGASAERKPKVEKQIVNKPSPPAQFAPRVDFAKFGVAMPIAARPQAEPRAEWKDFAADFGGAHQEFVDGVKESETTALNTREFVFFSYFQRIRKQLDQAWQPLLQEHVAKIFKKGRSLASEMHYKTSTVVTLNEKGEVVQVKVIQESGTFDLDEAAIEAFNRAGPFPNPPQALRDQQGQVEIHWDFILRT